MNLRRLRILEARRTRRVELGPIREVTQWNVDTDNISYRHDYRWKDPASGWVFQYGVDHFMPAKAPEGALAEMRRMARHIIERMLAGKCGNAHICVPLPLPRTAPGRYI